MAQGFTVLMTNALMASASDEFATDASLQVDATATIPEA
jgi:hypothetical protein